MHRTSRGKIIIVFVFLLTSIRKRKQQRCSSQASANAKQVSIEAACSRPAAGGTPIVRRLRHGVRMATEDCLSRLLLQRCLA